MKKDVYGHVIVRIGVPMPHFPWKTYEGSLTRDELLEIVEKYSLEFINENYESSACYANVGWMKL